MRGEELRSFRLHLLQAPKLGEAGGQEPLRSQPVRCVVPHRFDGVFLSAGHIFD